AFAGTCAIKFGADFHHQVDEFQVIEKNPELRRKLQMAANDGWPLAFDEDMRTSVEIQREADVEELLKRPRVMTPNGSNTQTVGSSLDGSNDVDSPSKSQASVVQL